MRSIGAAVVAGGVSLTVLCASEAPSGGKLDLRLRSPRATTSIEGSWIYTPLDGGEPYRIEIRASQGGFYEFEGRREGTERPLLEFDKAGEGSGFRGEVSDGFDPCVSAGARFRLYPAAASLVFEPALPMSAPFVLTLPGPCTSVRRFYLAARGRGDQIRIKPAEELAGLPPPPATDARRPQDPSDPLDTGRTRNDTAGATVTLGAPTAPDGTEVALLGSLRDTTRKLWHHVRLIGPASDSDEGAAESVTGAKASAGPGEAGGKRIAPSGAGAAGSGSASGKGLGSPSRPAGPVTGYVPADSVVVRWGCRLERSAGEAAH
jgi:hypothetical protein